MSSLTLLGDTSGSVILQAPAIAGSGTVTLPTTGGTIRTTTTPGTVLQIQHGSSSTTVTTTNVYSGAVSSGITATITPTSTSNKIVIQASVECYGNNAIGTNLAVFRNGTNLTAGGQNFLTRSYPLNSQLAINVPILFVDTPNSTSALTYTIYFWSTSNGNPCTVGQDNTQQVITLTEIAA